jgi:hypothetical protein
MGSLWAYRLVNRWDKTRAVPMDSQLGQQRANRSAPKMASQWVRWKAAPRETTMGSDSEQSSEHPMADL